VKDRGTIPVAARSKVCGRLVAGIAGSNPAKGMDVCILCLYCNMFAGSIFTMEVYCTQKFNTLQLITVRNPSRLLTLVLQILELQQMRVMSSSF
jgi:hypothetical protein